MSASERWWFRVVHVGPSGKCYQACHATGRKVPAELVIFLKMLVHAPKYQHIFI